MFFIIKKVFWTSLLLVAVSHFYPDYYPKEQTKSVKSEIKDIMVITKDTFSYASNICNERPNVCILWSKVFDDFKHHTLHGANIVYRLAKSTMGNAEKNFKNQENN